MTPDQKPEYKPRLRGEYLERADPGKGIWINMSPVVDGRLMVLVMTLISVRENKLRPIESTIGVN